MNRRGAIKDIVLFAGTVIILPSCLRDNGKTSIALKNLDITAHQENLLAEIASALIPRTEIPGAKETGSHLFVLKMLDDCYEKDVQLRFISGLNQFEETAKKRFGNSFITCNDEQKLQMLAEAERNEKFPEDVYEFYRIMKQRTIQGFMTSEYVLMNIKKYEMIPSVKYNGYAPVNK